MSNKPTTAAKTTVTRDVAKLDQETGNVYETVAILGKRANQISMRIKEELHSKLEEFAMTGENLEEVYENREQIEVSKHYERMPKPGALAIQELMEGKLYWRRGGEEAPAEVPQQA
ncbi:MAG: DNA-directed RNA polymerase subunit omega [Flavobacteriales bacterium]|jgi:DNA-directed RNA polymerase subunit K/omega|nr:MAG: DNA-directed RNA polymerase subunit omega [Flavobacteriales bacterium]